MFLKKMHKNTTWRGKILIPIFILMCLSVPFGLWAQKIHSAAEELRENPAFRIVESCSEPRMEIFEDHILKDFQIVPCD